MEKKRSHFSGRLGFILAAAGSAVGLGNIWRFPYLAAKYGGGLFLIIYLILVFTLGYTVMTSEIAIGRKTGQSPWNAFAQLNKKYKFIGIILSIVPFIILSYYSVIGGWVIKYLCTYLTGGHAAAAGDDFFSNFISQPFEPLIWAVVFVLLCFIVVVRGVKNGIEKASKILMPVLVLLSIAVAVFSVIQPGAMEGVKYFLIPNFSDFKPETILAAMGQMFYSLSLAMGIMITFGSYLKKEDDIEKSVGRIELFDTAIAILAGLMIIPAVSAFNNGDMSKMNAGPGLMFQTLPKVFDSMGMGTIVGVLFFLLVLFAAATSAISLMEAVVATVCDKTRLSRTQSTILVTVGAILLGIPSSLGNGVLADFTIFGFQFLDFMDFITNAVLMPIGALLTCLFVGYVIKCRVVCDEVKLSSKFRREKMFIIITKYVAPICIIAILISSILDSLGVYKL